MWINISISCLGSERGSASSSPWVSLCGEMAGVGRWWKGTTTVSEALMVWEEWSRLRWHFYSIGEWKSDDPGRVVGGGGLDSMLQFWLKRGDNVIKHCQKMKQMQRAHLGSMERKCHTMLWRGDVGRRRGDTGEGKRRRRRLLGWRKSYWAKKWRKSMWSIQLLQMDSKNLKEWWVNLFFKTYKSEI
jgi:hypothetical protein